MISDDVRPRHPSRKQHQEHLEGQEAEEGGELERRIPETLRAETLSDYVAPIFNLERGQRLCIARMKNHWDQAELGRRLGVSQQVISKIEQGRLVRAQFTLTQFQAVLGKATSYVLRGQNASLFNVEKIAKAYWDRRFKKGQPKHV